jgi:tetratricopeptide (TPR) repeat protein
VVYAGLLAGRRRDLHTVVVDAIERLHADRLVEHVERLAHHARQGEVWDKAVRYLRQAGAKGLLRSANRGAADYFEQALDALGRLPETPTSIAESLDLRFDLRHALLPLGEQKRTGAILDEAEALAEAVGDERRLARALNLKVTQFTQAGDYAAALQAGLRALAIGELQADIGIQVVAHALISQVYMARGGYREAVRHCEAALALIPEALTQERFGMSVPEGSLVRFFLAIALMPLGQFAEAFRRLREAMHIAEETGQVLSLLQALLGLGTLKLDQGDFAGAVAPLERGLELCRTREVPLLIQEFAGALGAAYSGTGRRAEAVALMEARRAFEQIQRYWLWPGRVGALGEAYLLDGRLADATRIAEDGLAAARQWGERGVEGQLLRLLGDIASHPDRLDAERCEGHYHQALALAQPRSMRPLVAHCHLGLGKLYRRTGKREQAHEHLTTTTTMYREMGMTYWLEKAEVETRELG